MYYVILVVLAVILFILRKRIIGGLVGVISLLLVVGLTIFMLDFFWLGQDYKGDERDVRNFDATQPVVEEYDEIVKDPVQKAKDVGNVAMDKGSEVNDSIKDVGSALDEKLGIQKDGSNNNLWGSDDNKKQETKNTESQGNTEEGTKVEVDNKEVEENDESEIGNTKQKNQLTFSNLHKAESEWGISTEDAKFVKSASPFNLGEFSNGSITIVVEESGVSLK